MLYERIVALGHYFEFDWQLVSEYMFQAMVMASAV